MKLTITEPQIDIGIDGFDGHDFLGRKSAGEQLTRLVDRIEDPIVIAVDGGWGTGKSFFLKLWAGAHKNEFSGDARVIYFDAFEHDFLDDPLISLVGAIASAPAKTFPQKAVKQLKKAVFPLARIGLRAAAALATAGATEIAGPALDVAMSKVGSAADDLAGDFWKREEGKIAAMKGFRSALEGLAAPAKKGSPLAKIVFIVDKLDRCRPDYALALLEIIKHFFVVPGIHFVLGANLHALESSVHARYGQGINAFEYLQKFIHLRMALPKDPASGGNGMPALTYFNKIAAGQGISTAAHECWAAHLRQLSKNRDISLRDVERILSYAALLPANFDTYRFGYQIAIIGGVLMRVISPTLYKKLRKQTLSLAEVVEFLSLPTTNLDSAERWERRIYICWARVLMAEPDAQIWESTSGFFDTYPHDQLKQSVERVLTAACDTFNLAAE